MGCKLQVKSIHQSTWKAIFILLLILRSLLFIDKVLLELQLFMLLLELVYDYY